MRIGIIAQLIVRSETQILARSYAFAMYFPKGEGQKTAARNFNRCALERIWHFGPPSHITFEWRASVFATPRISSTAL